MFNLFTKTKIFETTDIEKKNKVEECLRENNIEFSIDVEDLHHRNAFDAADLGHVIGKPKDVYMFWVNRKVKNEALNLIKKIS